MNIWLASFLTITTLPIFFIIGGRAGLLLWLFLVIVTHFSVESKKKAKLEARRHKELLAATKANAVGKIEK